MLVSCLEPPGAAKTTSDVYKGRHRFVVPTVRLCVKIKQIVVSLAVDLSDSVLRQRSPSE